MNPPLTYPVEMLLKIGIRAGVSDYHLDAGRVPAWRLDGRLTIQQQMPVVTAEDLESILKAAACDPAGAGDASVELQGELFRISYGHTRTGNNVVMRHILKRCFTLEELQVPPAFVKLLEAREGLVLISGPAGAGKSRTLNGAINHLNGQEEGGTITILGDPIEFFHEDRYCRIRHREYGKDFTSWETMLEQTLRQDPDIIAITEMRDYATMKMALAAAETGHLVLGTLHNASAKDAITRILDACPENDQEQQRAIVGKAWRGVLAQQLVPRAVGGRVAAFELLINTIGVANLIRENRYRQIDDEILRGHQHGMVRMDESLKTLCEKSEITRETALKYAFNPATLQKILK